MNTRNAMASKLLFALATLLLAAPALAQGTFNYASPTYVVGKTSTTITVLAGGLVTLDCPSTGVLGIF